MQRMMLIVLAGGAGALSRYILAGVFQRLAGGSFPAGTFIVNMLGCLFFGLVWGILEERAALGPQVRVMVLTGFMGAFTTFSTFAFETVALARAGQWLYAAANFTGQNLIGFALLFLGLKLARLVP